MQATVHQTVLEALAQYGAGSEDDLLGKRLADTGLDSLDLMELLDTIEETCGIRIEDDAVSAETTVAGLVAFIEQARARQSG